MHGWVENREAKTVDIQVRATPLGTAAEIPKLSLVTIQHHHRRPRRDSPDVSHALKQFLGDNSKSVVFGK